LYLTPCAALRGARTRMRNAARARRREHNACCRRRAPLSLTISNKALRALRAAR